MTEQVRHDERKRRFELEVEGGVALATYRQDGDIVYITHTETPPALQGRGIASRLVKGMLADLRDRKLRVVPLCSFVVDYFERHDEERDLLAKP